MMVPSSMVENCLVPDRRGIGVSNGSQRCRWLSIRDIQFLRHSARSCRAFGCFTPRTPRLGPIPVAHLSGLLKNQSSGDSFSQEVTEETEQGNALNHEDTMAQSSSKVSLTLSPRGTQRKVITTHPGLCGRCVLGVRRPLLPQRPPVKSIFCWFVFHRSTQRKQRCFAATRAEPI